MKTILVLSIVSPISEQDGIHSTSMKTILVLSILFCVIAFPALGDLTDADLDKIRLIVKEEVKTEIASSEQRITKYIDAKIEGVDKHLAGVDKRLLLYNWILIILMPLIVATVGIPTALIAWRSGRDRSLERRIETLAQEIETLKQQRSA